MREVLFRGKREDNGNLVYGYYAAINGEVFILEPKDSIHGFIWVKVIPETVGQFTGLTDKNETKIFEGDILEFGVLDKKTTVVTFDKGCFMHLTNVLYIGCNEMEIIGNIFDNPELLENE